MNLNATAEKYFDGNRGPDLRMTPHGERRTFEVGKMWEVHHEITRLLLLGMKGVEIAERLGVSEAMVNYTRNSKIVEEKLDVMKGARDAETIDLSKEIRMKAPKALKLLEQIIDGDMGTIGELASPALRAKTAESWMDRAGYPAQRSGTGIQLHAHFDAQDLIEVKKRAKESGIVIDMVEE